MHWLSGHWIKGGYCRQRRLGISRDIAPISVAEDRRILASGCMGRCSHGHLPRVS